MKKLTIGILASRDPGRFWVLSSRAFAADAGGGRRCAAAAAAAKRTPVQGEDRLRLRGRHGRRRPAASRRRARQLARRRREHSSLIEIRKDFIPEMLKSLEDV